MAYSIYSSHSTYPTCGDYTIYFATNPRNTTTVLEQIDAEIQLFLSDGIGDEEFLHAKAQIRSDYILSLESAYNRMHANGHNLLLLQQLVLPEVTLQNIQQVTKQDVMDRAEEILRSPHSLAFVGKGEENNG